jgi:hypothetical protein
LDEQRARLPGVGSLSQCATDVSQVLAGLLDRSLGEFRWARATTS